MLWGLSPWWLVKGGDGCHGCGGPRGADGDGFSDCNLGGGGHDGGSPVLEVKDLRR